MRHRLLAFLMVSALATAVSAAGPQGRDLEGNPVAPFEVGSDVLAVVLFFTATDCPIANRYSPEIARLASGFSSAGIKSWLVYSNDTVEASTVAAHRNDYQLDLPALIDGDYAVAEYADAEVTPEAVVYLTKAGQDPQLVYRGRIDNRYQGFGKYRPAATEHDLREVLQQIADGQVPAFRETEAIGCYIPRP